MTGRIRRHRGRRPGRCRARPRSGEPAFGASFGARWATSRRAGGHAERAQIWSCNEPVLSHTPREIRDDLTRPRGSDPYNARSAAEGYAPTFPPRSLGARPLLALGTPRHHRAGSEVDDRDDPGNGVDPLGGGVHGGRVVDLAPKVDGATLDRDLEAGRRGAAGADRVFHRA